MKQRVQNMVWIKASELRAHPHNWRLHPMHQKTALSALIDRIGFVDAVIAREKDGGYELLDGHLRTELSGEEEIPVLLVDLNDKEAGQMLATFDPVGELAKIDRDLLNELAPDFKELEDDADLRRMLAEITQEQGQKQKDGEAPDHEVEGMALEPNEHYDYVMVLAQSTHEWNVMCDLLGLDPINRRNRVGVARAIHAAKLLNLLGAGEVSGE